MVGLLASCLAYGRVRQILSSVSEALRVMGDSPFEFVMSSEPRDVERAFRGFRHRFSTGQEVVQMLLHTKHAIRAHGTLEACFLRAWSPGEGDVIPGLCHFARAVGAGECRSLLPLPERGSACKRLNLFLRWMVRRDEVDPGGWVGVPPSALVVPMDVHMHRIGVAFGLTGRRQPDIRAAREVTEAFRAVSPADPIRYDFALTRPGILSRSAPERSL